MQRGKKKDTPCFGGALKVFCISPRSVTSWITQWSFQWQEFFWRSKSSLVSSNSTISTFFRGALRFLFELERSMTDSLGPLLSDPSVRSVVAVGGLWGVLQTQTLELGAWKNGDKEKAWDSPLLQIHGKMVRVEWEDVVHINSVVEALGIAPPPKFCLAGDPCDSIEITSCFATKWIVMWMGCDKNTNGQNQKTKKKPKTNQKQKNNTKKQKQNKTGKWSGEGEHTWWLWATECRWERHSKAGRLRRSTEEEGDDELAEEGGGTAAAQQGGLLTWRPPPASVAALAPATADFQGWAPGSPDYQPAAPRQVAGPHSGPRLVASRVPWTNQHPRSGLTAGRVVRPKPLGLYAGPLPHRQPTLCLSTESWGQVYTFP